MRGFSKFCGAVSDLAGRPLSFILAVLIIVGWCVTGPLFHFSDTWQLVINTSTTIVTFLMVFLIQNTQNRESKAMQLKLDELIRSIDGAHNALLNLEELSTDEIAHVHQHYKHIAHRARLALKFGKADTGTPEPKFSRIEHDDTPLVPTPSDLADAEIDKHDQEEVA